MVNINKQKFIEDFANGMSYNELGKAHGCSKGTAFNYAKKWGLKQEEPGWVAPMLDDYLERDFSKAELARKYKVSIDQIRYRIMLWERENV